MPPWHYQITPTRVIATIDSYRRILELVDIEEQLQA